MLVEVGTHELEYTEADSAMRDCMLMPHAHSYEFLGIEPAADRAPGVQH